MPTYTLGPHDTPICTLDHMILTNAHWDPITPTFYMHTGGPSYAYLQTVTPLLLPAHWDA